MSGILKIENEIITGSAGTGKTTEVGRRQDQLTKQKVKWIACAPTGAAAQLVRGQTIHSLFGFRPNANGLGIKSVLRESQKENLRQIEVFFIDEISMVTNVMFDLISKVLKDVMKNEQKFGGKKIILSGDVLQLPPIIKDGENYFFYAKNFNLSDYKVTYLEKVHRQDDLGFINFLKQVREGVVDHEFIKSKGLLTLRPNIDYTKLFHVNHLVDAENKENLNRIKEPLFTFPVLKEHGNSYALEKLKKATITPSLLEIKVGAKVIFTRNDFGVGYANGNSGIVKKINSTVQEQSIEIFNSTIGKLVKVKRVTFSNYDQMDSASFEQFPLALGYSMSIHKAQGTSLDNMLVDFGGTNRKCNHLVYTALSRVRGLNGLCIRNFNSSLVQLDQDALEFDYLLKKQNRHATYSWMADKAIAK